MKDKINEFLKRSLSNEETLKRIALYLFLIAVLLLLIFFKLNEINKNIIESPFMNSVSQKEYESVSDVFIEKEEDISNILPIYGENEDNSTTNTTGNDSEITTDTKETEANNEEKTEVSSSNSNNSTKKNFVINANSNKIHYADCSFVNRMKEENRKYVQLSDNELNEYINNGYTLCSTCGG